MKRRRKAEKQQIAKLIILDEDGILVEQDFYQLDNEEVEVATQQHLGAELLPLAGVALVGAHALLKGSEVPEALQTEVMMALKQVEALSRVRHMAKNQKRLDRRDRGVSDDWPIDDTDTDLPF